MKRQLLQRKKHDLHYFMSIDSPKTHRLEQLYLLVVIIYEFNAWVNWHQTSVEQSK